MQTTLEIRAGQWSTGSAYNADGHRRKHLTHCAARAALRKLAGDLGLSQGDYDIRTNKGGMAVSGETTLHTDRLYVQIGGSFTSGGMRIMFRTCKGRRDYCGGSNHYAPLSALADGSLLRALRRLAPDGIPHEGNAAYRVAP